MVKQLKYDEPSSCNKCGSSNKLTVKDDIANVASEFETKCKQCGFEDYWAYGFFKSHAKGFNKSQKY